MWYENCKTIAIWLEKGQYESTVSMGANPEGAGTESLFYKDVVFHLSLAHTAQFPPTPHPQTKKSSYFEHADAINLNRKLVYMCNCLLLLSPLSLSIASHVTLGYWSRFLS